MIAIISHQAIDTSTDLVMDWIEALGGTCIRINGEDLTGDSPFTISLQPDFARVSARISNASISSEDLEAVWFRRWHTLTSINLTQSIPNKKIATSIRSHLASEISATLLALCAAVGDTTNWLGHPKTASPSKFRVLDIAQQMGLQIPKTILTNNKEDAALFVAETNRTIVKPIGNAHHISLNREDYVTYTAELTQDTLESFPSMFFPSLLQELIEKEFEIRSFYLDGRFFSMAIFSQADSKTEMDFRNYNNQKPNRCVPYLLSRETEKKLHQLMVSLELNTGSIDLIRTQDKREIFLEVNPVGQFGMVSYPCNYYLEREIAEFLLEKNQ